MRRFFERLLGRRDQSSSGEIAKRRLRLVLAHDRAGIPPGVLETVKDEIIAVISRHVDIDAEGVQVTFSDSGHESSLVADIPLAPRRGRPRR